MSQSKNAHHKKFDTNNKKNIKFFKPKQTKHFEQTTNSQIASKEDVSHIESMLTKYSKDIKLIKLMLYLISVIVLIMLLKVFFY